MVFLEKELQTLGFSDKEAKVYLSGIELGPSTAQELSRKSGVNRATTYVMIDALSERGLMSSYLKGKKRLFVAGEPKHILDLIKDEKRKIDEKESRAKEILADLESVTSKEGQPKVAFFEGERGIEQLRRSILDSSEQVVEEFSPIDEAYKYFPPSDSDHRDQFRKKKKIRLIYTSKKGAFLPEAGEGVERRFISSEQFQFEGDIAIYGSRVNIIYYAPKLIGVRIEHEGISRTFHNLFTLAWLGAAKKNEGIGPH